MAFTVKEFPHKLFKSYEEYKEYKKLREKVINKKEKTKVKIKISKVLKANNPVIRAIITQLNK